MKSHTTIEGYRKLIEKEIGSDKYGSNPKGLYEPIRYLMHLGGKRLRPLLTILAYALFKREVKGAIPFAAAVEVFHNFTLMHDDIMDHSSLRRGVSTVHTKWDMPTAILSGDAMLVKVYEQWNKLPPRLLSPVLTAFNKCALGVCEGQRMDMDFESRSDVTEEEYLKMIRLKTAVLLGFSLELGCLLAAAPKASKEALYQFGVDMGVGFQLKDDWLDAYGDPSRIGKQRGGDIITNKKTLLLIHAMSTADGATRVELQRWLDAMEFDREEKITAVIEIFDLLKTREWVENKIDRRFDHAFRQLSKVKTSLKAKETLMLFARELGIRQS